MRVSHWLITALTAVGYFCALATAVRSPLQFPMPAYFHDIQVWSANGHIEDTFTPLGYPLFAAPAYRLMGTSGIVMLQLFVYLGMIFLAVRLLKQVELPSRWAGAGALLIAFHPEIALSIVKVWDVDLTAFLLLLIILLSLRLQASGRNPWTTVAFGAAFGAGVFCRPNYCFLIFVFFFALETGLPSRRKFAAPIAIAGAMAVLIFAVLGVLSHGSAFRPRNGPYNLFAGNNPYSAEALLEHLNAEPSIAQAVIAEHASPVPNVSDPAAFYRADYEGLYKSHAALFALHHPLQEAGLVLIKLLTFFRPDTKVHPLRSAQGVVKGLLALPAVVFLILLALPGRPPLDRQDRLLLLAYVCYIAPFLLTNSDPRFRIPLDPILLLHSVRLVYLRRRYTAAIETTAPWESSSVSSQIMCPSASGSGNTRA